jgi:hypothetical protein
MSTLKPVHLNAEWHPIPGRIPWISAGPSAPASNGISAATFPAGAVARGLSFQSAAKASVHELLCQLVMTTIDGAHRVVIGNYHGSVSGAKEMHKEIALPGPGQLIPIGATVWCFAAGWAKPGEPLGVEICATVWVEDGPTPTPVVFQNWLNEKPTPVAKGIRLLAGAKLRKGSPTSLVALSMALLLPSPTRPR